MSIYIGVMTGTSVDGLDIAAVELEPAFKLIASTEFSLPDELQTSIRTLAQSETIAWQSLGKVDALLGEFIGDCVNEFIESLIRDKGIERTSITAIGSHGQTVHHSPDSDPAFTVQIGDASRICQRTQLTVVSDFRRADMAAGGQGAPLVPLFHQQIFKQAAAPQATGDDIAVCNIGGIANITLIPGDPERDLLGFDTGPGNTLLDAWCLQNTGKRYDRDGNWAATGERHAPLLSAMLGDPFVQRAPPKSTGVEHYNLQWLDRLLLQHAPKHDAPEDIQATLSEFTARSITSALRAVSPHCSQLILCGGGRHNTDLVRRLEENAVCRVLKCDELGVDGDALEAAAFAWLAAQTLASRPGNAPSVTGATQPMRLSTVTAPL